MLCSVSLFLVFCSSRRRHTRCALVTGVQTCALPISAGALSPSIDLLQYDFARTAPRREGWPAWRRPTILAGMQIGRASRRERAFQYVYISVVPVTLKNQLTLCGSCSYKHIFTLFMY